MALNLDTRQRAMLEEMHVRVWWPAADGAEDASQAADQAGALGSTPTPARAALSAAAGTPLTPSPAAGSAVHMPAPGQVATSTDAAEHGARSVSTPAAAPPTARAGGVGAVATAADMRPAGRTVEAPSYIPATTLGGWPAYLQEVAECNACGLCAGRKAPPMRPGADALPQQRDWLVVGEPPSEAEERAGIAFVGEAGQLLDNMLRAVQVSRSAEGAAGAWATNVVQCRPAMARIPEPDELLRCRQHIDQQIALLRPKVILAMGRFATQSLLGPDNPALVGKPFGQLRGSVHAHAGVSVVVMQHPERLLRAPAQKAEAWADLCRALEIVRGH